MQRERMSVTRNKCPLVSRACNCERAPEREPRTQIVLEHSTAPETRCEI